MEVKILTSSQYFKLLMLIYGVMLLAQVGTGAVFFFLRSTQEEVMQNNAELGEIFQYLIPILILMPFLGWFLSKSTLKKLKENDPLSDKLRTYQSTILVKYAFFEGASLFSLIAYFLTGTNMYLGIAAGLVLFFLSQIPTPKRLSAEVPLSLIDESKLNDPDAEVAEVPLKD